MGAALPRDGHQHVPGVELGAPGALHVPGGPLQDALEGGGLLRLAAPGAGLEGPVEVVLEFLLELGDVGAAGGQDLGGDLVARHGVEQVLQRDVLVAPPPGVGHGALESCLQFLRYRDHRRSCYSGSTVQRRGYSASRASSMTLVAFVSAIS